MNFSTTKSFIIGAASLGTFAGTILLSPDANAVTLGNFTTGTAGAYTFTLDNFNPNASPFSDYEVALSTTATGVQFALNSPGGSTLLTSGTYSINYFVTGPIGIIGLNQNAFNATSQKFVSATKGGPQLVGFPLTTTGNFVSGFVSPNLNSVYVQDLITIAPGGDLTSISNRFAVPEPLTILGAVTAMGLGASFKRKLQASKSGKKQDVKES